MAHNTDISLLDVGQIHKRTFDCEHDAIRTIQATSTSFEIELSASDGDSVTAKPDLLNVTGSLTDATTGTVVAETASTGIKSVQLYAKSTTTLTVAPTLSVQSSPTDSGDVWFTVATLGPSLTLNAVEATAVSTVVARRIRVITSAALPAAETASLYLIGESV